MQLIMDGNSLAGPHRSTQFLPTNIDRGTHQLCTQVVYHQSAAVFTYDISTSHTVRYSKLDRQPQPKLTRSTPTTSPDMLSVDPN